METETNIQIELTWYAGFWRADGGGCSAINRDRLKAVMELLAQIDAKGAR